MSALLQRLGRSHFVSTGSATRRFRSTMRCSSAHVPFAEERGLFNKIMVGGVLPIAARHTVAWSGVLLRL